MAASPNISSRTNLETFNLVWLDRLVNISQDNIDTKLLLRKAINHLKAFEESDPCIEYIRNLSREKIVLIVSGRYGHEVIPLVHRLPQLVAIYVYCSDRKRNEPLAKNFFKVKGIIVTLDELLTKIQVDQAQRNEYKIDEPLPMNIFHARPEQKQLFIINNDDFINFQLLINCLSRITGDANDRNEFISICKEEYRGNETELNILREFQENYSCERALWWFTRESFVCRMLNKAFQVVDVNLLYYLHFIIRDIHQQLKETKYLSPICSYRAQIMPNEQYELLKRSVGELISINTFLPTIPNRERALAILENADESDDFKRVLFEIHADPRLHDVKPFSEISSLNSFTGVQVILFMVGTIFRPLEIRREKKITIIAMETCSDSDQKIKTTLDNMKTECYYDETNLLSLGYILSKMKKFDFAEECFRRFLETSPDHQATARCYQGLGGVALKNQDYDTSILWYQKALDINRSIYGVEDAQLATELSTIAHVYTKKKAFFDAFECHTEALKILILGLGKDHLKVGVCYKNMGYSLEMEGRYPEAIEYYQKALTIRQRNLVTEHPDIAKIYDHMANAYNSAGQYNQAIKHYQIALDILTKVYYDKHPEVIKTMKKIGIVHETSGQLNQARRQLENVAALYHQIYRPNHPEVIQIELDIFRISSKLK